jgi:hypothetical protein
MSVQPASNSTAQGKHMTVQTLSTPFDAGATQADLEALESGLAALMQAYQSSRSALRAWLVVRYAEAICRHPELGGGDEARCTYQRLARQWRWLASVNDQLTPSGDRP